jgi:hypothetical protein
MWVRNGVTYRRDPVALELFTAPDLLAGDVFAGRAAGDCDDHVALGAALAEVLGHPSRFRVGGHKIGKDGSRAWSHVWRQTWNGERWVDFDDTAKKRPPGWSPAERFTATGHGGEPVATLAGMRSRSLRVGVPCVDEFGQLIPGVAKLVDVDRLGDAGAWSPTMGIGGLGKFKVSKLKKLAKKITPKPLQKIASATGKLAKKALPVAALAVNVFPGVGQVASLALTAAAVAQKAQQQKKRAKQAEANYAREQASAVAAEQAAYDAAAAAPIPMPMELPSQQTGGTVVQIPSQQEYYDASNFAQSRAPDPLAYAEPPNYAPAEAFEPSWPDDKESDGLYGLRRRRRGGGLGGFWDTVASGVSSLVQQTSIGQGQLTVGGVSIPLGRDAQRLLQPIQRYIPALRPTAPTPAIVQAPPPGGAPGTPSFTIVPPQGQGTSAPTSPAGRVAGNKGLSLLALGGLAVIAWASMRGRRR